MQTHKQYSVWRLHCFFTSSDSVVVLFLLFEKVANLGEQFLLC